MGRQILFLNPLIYLLCPLISKFFQLLHGGVFIHSSFLNDCIFVYIVFSECCYCFVISAGKIAGYFTSGLEIYTKKLALRLSCVFFSIILDAWQQCV